MITKKFITALEINEDDKRNIINLAGEDYYSNYNYTIISENLKKKCSIDHKNLKGHEEISDREKILLKAMGWSEN